MWCRYVNYCARHSALIKELLQYPTSIKFAAIISTVVIIVPQLVVKGQLLLVAQVLMINNFMLAPLEAAEVLIDHQPAADCLCNLQLANN